MEKQEARIKCTGCGSSYKLKVPVTDKPVNFKCKKCGKVLKVRLAPTGTPEASAPAATPTPPPPPSPPPSQGFDEGPVPGFETTQFPDDDVFDPDKVGTLDALGHGADSGHSFDDSFASGPPQDFSQPTFVTDAPQRPQPTRMASLDETVRIEEPVFEQGYADQLQPGATPGKPAAAADSQKQRGVERRWLVLDDEQVKGPFTDAEVGAMIKQGEIGPDTPLRMGQRPWIKASQVADFKHLFPGGAPPKPEPKRTTTASEAPEDNVAEETPADGPPFYKEFPSIAPYPLGNGNWQPMAIFCGIASALCVVLAFDFLIGLPVCIAGWILLYGYLAMLMAKTRQAPKAPPPSWDFSRAKDMLTGGAPVFLILLVFSLLPVTIALLLMIAFFLNGMDLLGYVFIALTVIVYAASLFLAPAALLIYGAAESIGTALNPGKVLKLITSGSTPYKMLAIASIAAGLAGMLVVLLAVFLTDIPVAGFIVAGLLMAVVLSYANFIWFHLLGRFSRENIGLMRKVLAPGKA